MVVIESISVSGVTLPGFPVTVTVNDGVKAPWVSRVASQTYVTPCVLPSGEVVAPARREEGAIIINFDGKGIRKLLSTPIDGMRPEKSYRLRLRRSNRDSLSWQGGIHALATYRYGRVGIACEVG